MITKEKIADILREETWVEVDSARVHGIEEAAEKVLKAIEAAEQSVQADLALCPVCDFEQKTDQVCEEHGVYKIMPRR